MSCALGAAEIPTLGLLGSIPRRGAKVVGFPQTLGPLQGAIGVSHREERRILAAGFESRGGSIGM